MYKVSVKTESIRKFSHFNFQWANACTRIISISNILHSFLRFSRAIKKINVQSYKTYHNSKEQVLMGARENKLEKLQISLNEILCMMILPVFPQFLWNLKFIFSGFHEKLPLVLLKITNYIYSPWKVWKRMRYCLKYFGTTFLSTEN